ncbi:histidine kinase [Rhodobacteraceae bacterium]|nr:histidine kinase [Paracoccaceae bacterium]
MADVLLSGLIVLGTSLVTVVCALLVVSRLMPKATQAQSDMGPQHPMLERTVFLFDGAALVDATPPARLLLEAVPTAHDDWARVLAFLMPRFEGLQSSLAQMRKDGRIELYGCRGLNGAAPLRLIAEDVNGLTRLTVIDPDAEGQGILVDGLSQRAMEDELETLRHALDLSPSLVWQETASGEPVWANRAYAQEASNGEGTWAWPLPQLFGFERGDATTTPHRTCLTLPDGTERWFDCHSYRLRDGWLHFAQSVDALVSAEQSLREFVQTLSRTFADLPIGLAVFNQAHELHVFNPALTDLTSLQVSFLANRPTLYAFLDRLRETRIMPDSHDYRSWRERMATLESEASMGRHVETWSLPDGRTYRITGRPHPGGSLALLIEDISPITAQTRQHQAEQALNNAILDAMSEAVAVFDAAGRLQRANAAFWALWPHLRPDGQKYLTLNQAILYWSQACEPAPIWDGLRHAQDFGDGHGHLDFGDTLCLRSGEALILQARSLETGALMVTFLSSCPSLRTMSGPLLPKPSRVIAQ